MKRFIKIKPIFFYTFLCMVYLISCSSDSGSPTGSSSQGSYDAKVFLSGLKKASDASKFSFNLKGIGNDKTKNIKLKQQSIKDSLISITINNLNSAYDLSLSNADTSLYKITSLPSIRIDYSSHDVQFNVAYLPDLLAKPPVLSTDTVTYFISSPYKVSTSITFNGASKIANIKQAGNKLSESAYNVSGSTLSISKNAISSSNPSPGDVMDYEITYDTGAILNLYVKIDEGSLIPNFNFVDGFKGWIKTAGKADITISKEHAVSGGQSMLMNGSGFTTIYSPFGDAKPNTKYRFTAQIYADNDIQEGNIAIQFINSDGAVTPLKGKNYMNYSRKGEGRFVKTDALVVTSPADAVKVQVVIYTKNSKLWADNFVVQEVD